MNYLYLFDDYAPAAPAASERKKEYNGEWMTSPIELIDYGTSDSDPIIDDASTKPSKSQTKKETKKATKPAKSTKAKAK